jgi:hypothetical protein
MYISMKRMDGIKKRAGQRASRVLFCVYELEYGVERKGKIKLNV